MKSQTTIEIAMFCVSQIFYIGSDTVIEHETCVGVVGHHDLCRHILCYTGVFKWWMKRRVSDKSEVVSELSENQKIRKNWCMLLKPPKYKG